MTDAPLHRRTLLRAAALLAASSAFETSMFCAAKAETPAASSLPSLAASQAAFAFKLAKALETDRNANVVSSPASAAAALAVIALFADEQLTQSIVAALSLQPNNGRRDLDALLLAAKPTEAGPLALANSLALDASLKPSASLLGEFKQAHVKLFDDKALDDAALAHINGWVSEVTHGRIPKLLESMPDGAVLIALNALHFKDRWQTAFDPAKTEPKAFMRLDGSTVEKTFMHSGPRSALFRSDDRFIAARLPFATARFALTVITTKREPAPLKDFEPVAAWLSGDGFERGEGQIAIPPLALSAQLELKPALNALGLKDDGLIGFSGRPPSITAIAQRVDFTANEDGAEAAAATAVIASRSASTRYTNFIADKPFLLALNDRTTGLILLSGYVATP
ncbi:proteinase inhibitor I4 serpin [Rhodomicrobium vannielii ATCC 17100]|uniref:Proteinase inhibitor I4 serpin n=1 Tax=Rhodomicrobium vannielii (strain ATCC 17100 / DSM 162 / LMG 4299 / NCIMB 10020 / ATH 3.1.1) TaxID=648757 RepID=E3I573_RHOVT|nr:serpin family protein [Rhodomicrobium vannielii]ADP70523.1 proteinase inhibitor I4 serpin [Rhodomicrobium vannielii ATCC 17100]